jgi:hypothetical protein
LSSVEKGESRVKFIKGPYGSGKSFLLSYVTQKALNENYIVANVPIHSGFGFGKLDALYEQILGHLKVQRAQQTSTSFEMIFQYWLESLKSAGDQRQATKNIYEMIKTLSEYNSSFSNVLLIYIRALIAHDFELSTIAAAWIKGDHNMASQLKKRLNVKGSIDAENALEIFAGFVKMVHLLGYKGLVITFDEAEMIMQQRVDTRMKAYGNIRQLLDLAGSGVLEHCGFVFAGTDQFFEDDEKGLKSYMALHQRIGKPISVIDGQYNVRQPVIQIQPLIEEDYGQLGRKIIEYHEQVYNYQYKGDVEHLVTMTKLESVKVLNHEVLTVRVYMKKLIELLDLQLDNPELPLFKRV